MKKLNQKGFHVLPIVLIIVVLTVVGFVGWRALKPKKSQTTQSTTQTQTTEEPASNVTWEFTGTRWRANGNPPACPEPLAFKTSPADISKATSVLYPGQKRGGDYKPHGGLRFDGLKNTEVTVKAPIKAKLVEASRYIEMGEVQYLLSFVNDCGISYRLDHLLQLSPKMQTEIDKLPAAKQDDSRTTRFEQPIVVSEGDVIATGVGFEKMGNTAFDFGVYDLRQINTAAQNSSYAQEHQDEFSQAAFALCWFDMLPSADASKVKSLPPGDPNSGKTSDYCK